MRLGAIGSRIGIVEPSDRADFQRPHVRWKMYKNVFRYSAVLDKPIVEPQFPMTCDLTSGPHEEWNLFDTKMTHGWVFESVFRLIGQHEESVKKYPTIRPGEDFKGYPAEK